MSFDVRRDGDPVAAARDILAAKPEPNAAARALQVALSGWGYDFHHPANVARSNDLLVRQHVAGWIRDAATATDELERRYARARVAPATREKPFPDPEVARSIRALRGLRDKLQALASRIDALETPAGDRIWNRFSKERALLDALITADIALLAYAQTIRTAVRQLEVASVDTEMPSAQLEMLLFEIEKQLSQRADVLLI